MGSEMGRSSEGPEPEIKKGRGGREWKDLRPCDGQGSGFLSTWGRKGPGRGECASQEVQLQLMTSQEVQLQLRVLAGLPVLSMIVSALMVEM